MYPGVMDTLIRLRERGTRLVAYTESMEFYSMIRMKKLGLDGVIDVLWSPADHPLPEGYERRHAFEITAQRFTPAGELKPNPKVLLDIIAAQGETPDATVYVGDNLLKDIAMAQSADVAGIYAAYGAAQETEGYACLKRVTHWTPEEVSREQEVIDRDEVVPAYTLNSFADILGMFDFVSAVPYQGVIAVTAAEEEQALAIAVEAWKKTVDVQQHFNTIEMQIRNLGITVVTAAIAAAAVLRTRSVPTQTVHGHSLNLAASNSTGWASGMIVFGALIAWAAFYFMDRWWYHRFLGAAGAEAGRLEALVSESLHSNVL